MRSDIKQYSVVVWWKGSSPMTIEPLGYQDMKSIGAMYKRMKNVGRVDVYETTTDKEILKRAIEI